MVLQKISLLFPFSKPLPFENFVKYIDDLKLYALLECPKKSITQLTFACSKSIIETLEKGVKYVQS